MELTFNIEGEFVTKTARAWFYEEKRPYKEIEKFLLNCMCGTEIPLKTLKKYVEDILKGKRKFVGSTKDNTFCLVEDNKINNLAKYYEELKEYNKLPFEICEYGFINPEGKYIPVKWCRHAQWASDYLKNNFSENGEWFKFMNKFNCNSTDTLVEGLNWILIDNPHQGNGIINMSNIITKAQKETLYDYLIFFNRIEEANELYRE